MQIGKDSYIRQQYREDFLKYDDIFVLKMMSKNKINQ